MDHQTLKFDREKGGKGEQKAVQSPSLPQLQNEGSGAEQFHSLLAPVNWGTALNSVLVPQVNTQSHLSPSLPCCHPEVLNHPGSQEHLQQE